MGNARATIDGWSNQGISRFFCFSLEFGDVYRAHTTFMLMFQGLMSNVDIVICSDYTDGRVGLIETVKASTQKYYPDSKARCGAKGNRSFSLMYLYLSLIILTLLPTVRVNAEAMPKSNYFNVGYGSSIFAQKNNPDIKSGLSVSLNLGHSYHLHKKTVGGLLWFDLDATWVNIAYSDFNVEHIDWQSSLKCKYLIPTIGMQFGPAISLVPFKKSQIHIFARYSPTLDCIIVNDSDSNISVAYGSFWNFGLEFNYRAIGVGLDYSTGNTKLPRLEFMSNIPTGKKEYSVLKSLKFIISIKF